MKTTMIRAGALVLIAMLTACSGGGSLPYQAPFGGGVTTSTSSSVALPSLTTSSFTVSGSLPPASVAAAIKESLSVSVPAGVTPLSERRVQNGVVGTATNLLYVTFSSSTAVTLTASPTLTFTSSSIQSGTVYSLALFSAGAWSAPFGPSQTATSDSITFASTNTAVTIPANGSVTFVLYTGNATTTIISALPATLSFDAGTPSSGTFGVFEIGYAGAFNATMTCTENPTGQSPGGNAFVGQFMGGGTTASQTPTSAGGSVTFTVDSGAETGTCAISVADTNGNTATVTLYVSSSNVTVTGKQRN